MHGVRWSVYSEDTPRQDTSQEGGLAVGRECRAPESSAWLVDSQSQWGWLGLGTCLGGW